LLLEERYFKLFWGAHTLSSLGTKMHQAALLWHIYTVSNSVIALGLIGLARLIPALLLILVGGFIADRGKRRTSLLAAQCSLAVIAIGLGFISLHSLPEHLLMMCLYATAVLTECASTFDGPARKSLIPLLVKPQNLSSAFSLTGISKNASKLVGPALMGLMVAYIDIAWVYIVNGISYLCVIWAVMMIPRTIIDPPLNQTDSAMSKESLHIRKITQEFTQALKEGFTFLWKSPVLLSILALDFVANLWAAATVLLPVYAQEVLHLGSGGYGLLASSIAAGGMIASFALLYLPDPVFKGRWIIVGGAMFGLGTILLGMSNHFLLSVFALALVGASDQFSSVLRNTLHQLSLPNELRGRLTAINMIFTKSGPRLGELEAGLTAAWIGLTPSIIFGGVACLISVGLIVYCYDELWWHQA
jgi:MFS family permease